MEQTVPAPHVCTDACRYEWSPESGMTFAEYARLHADRVDAAYDRDQDERDRHTPEPTQ